MNTAKYQPQSDCKLNAAPLDRLANLVTYAQDKGGHLKPITEVKTFRMQKHSVTPKEEHLLEIIRTSPEIASVLKICGEVDDDTRARIFALVFKARNKNCRRFGDC